MSHKKENIIIRAKIQIVKIFYIFLLLFGLLFYPDQNQLIINLFVILMLILSFDFLYGRVNGVILITQNEFIFRYWYLSNKKLKIETIKTIKILGESTSKKVDELTFQFSNGSEKEFIIDSLTSEAKQLLKDSCLQKGIKIEKLERN